MVLLCLLVMVAAAVLVKPADWFQEIQRVCSSIQTNHYPDAVDLTGVISPFLCRMIIDEAEKHAAQHGGWRTDRHDNYPTTDFNTEDIPALVYPVQNIVYRTIVPEMAKAFGLNPALLGIGEVFVAKYSPDHQRNLAAHTDGSDFSFVVTLNDGFAGGGTKFVKSGDIKRPEAGSGVAFCGKTRHAGMHVTGGTRYVLVGFLRYGTPGGCEDGD